MCKFIGSKLPVFIEVMAKIRNKIENQNPRLPKTGNKTGKYYQFSFSVTRMHLSEMTLFYQYFV